MHSTNKKNISHFFVFCMMAFNFVYAATPDNINDSIKSVHLTEELCNEVNIMRKTVLLSIILFVFILGGCSISFEEKANQEIEKILNESSYENIIAYKGEGQNWKVTYIDEYTDICEKDSENKNQYYMKVKRNWILVYKGKNLNDVNTDDVNCYFKSPINGHSISAKFENGIFIAQEEKEQDTSIPRGQEDFKYEAIISWYEKNMQKNETIILHIDKKRLAADKLAE